MTVTLFRFASFLAAFLLFSIQPLAGKSILPLIGGAPHGWLVVLVFFQTTLVGGYALVLLTQRLSPVLAGIVHILLLITGISLFHSNTAIGDVDAQFAGDIYFHLWKSHGLAIVSLGAMAPLLQRLFTSIKPDNPFKLYAVSNAGSFIGLLAYPFFLEPFSGLIQQTTVWRYAYMALIVLLAVCVFSIAKKDSRTTTADFTTDYKTLLAWLLLSALPASMLSGVTSLISINIVSFPLLWVIPLAIYLASFILAFSDRAPVIRDIPFHFSVLTIFLLALAASDLANIMPASSLFHLLAFGLGAYLAHSRLYLLRPDPAQLPLYYFVIALGGALGGAINAFAVPVSLDHAYEFYIALALFLPFTKASLRVEPTTKFIRYNRICLALFILLAVSLPHFPRAVAGLAMPLIIGGFVFMTFKPVYVSVAFMVCLIAGVPQALQGNRELLSHRNFFGVMKVNDSQISRSLIHGTTLHGIEPKDKAFSGVPVSYYAKAGPAGQVLEIADKGPLAVIGLGTGQMGCYASTGRPISFFEIDPDVVDISHRYFRYLQLCPPEAIVVGDARLKLQDGTGQFQGIVLDAFSSDAIPAHLLTAEAMGIYLKRLVPDGYLLFHISNRYIDLKPILAAHARERGMDVLGIAHKTDTRKPDQRYDSDSEWVVLSRNQDLMARLAEKGWATPEPSDAVWSDDRFSILGTLKRPF